MRVLIVGAGIAGLTLAALLRQRGIAPDIIDSAPGFDRDDHIVGLYPFASRVLHGLGLYRNFSAISKAERPDEPHMLSRQDLLRLLNRVVDGDRLRMSITLQSIGDAGSRARACTSDGEAREYDLVVGADGNRSRIREFVSPMADIFDTRRDCWSWWVQDATNTSREFRAGRHTLSLFATARGAGIVAGAPRKNTLGKKLETRRLAKTFSRFDELAGQAYSATPGAEAMLHWPVADARARSWQRGRAVLLGDAACAFLPTSGLGASMAMEAASILADELSRSDAANISRAVAFYEARCRKRTEGAQDATRAFAKRLYSRNFLGLGLKAPTQSALQDRYLVPVIKKLTETPA